MKKKKGIHVFRYIWLCLFTFALVTAVTQSRYMAKTEDLSSEIQIAKPIVTMSKTTLLDVNGGDTRRVIAFTVQNYDLEDETQISEVTMQYSLKITTKTNLPVTFKLYGLLAIGNGYTRRELPITDGETTKFAQLPHTTERQHMYELELTFTKPPENVDILDAITIELDSEQVQNR